MFGKCLRCAWLCASTIALTVLVYSTGGLTGAADPIPFGGEHTRLDCDSQVNFVICKSRSPSVRVEAPRQVIVLQDGDGESQGDLSFCNVRVNALNVPSGDRTPVSIGYSIHEVRASRNRISSPFSTSVVIKSISTTVSDPAEGDLPARGVSSAGIQVKMREGDTFVPNVGPVQMQLFHTGPKTMGLSVEPVRIQIGEGAPRPDSLAKKAPEPPVTSGQTHDGRQTHE